MSGFLINDGEYACVPYGKKGYIIIHQGGQLERLCKTEKSARNYIKEHQRTLLKASQDPLK